MSTLDIARQYLSRGWKPVPIARGDKGPKGPGATGWGKKKVTLANVAKHFNGADQNVGVQFGEVSGGLRDVDLDCPEAVKLAARLLPPTDAIFGRASKPASHYLYVTPTADAKASKQFRDADNKVMVELRMGGGGKAAQTIFPGSIHPSGEALSWAKEGDPAHVPFEQLMAAVTHVAVGALLVRHWPTDDGHEAALRVAGFLARSGWAADDVASFVGIIAHAAGDEHHRDHVRTARDAAESHVRGEKVYGFPALQDFFGEGQAKLIAQWLNNEPEGVDRDGGVSIGDFVAYLPEHKYIFIPTGALWPASGVNACIHKPGGANKWLDRNASVEQMIWCPGEPPLIKDKLFSADGAWIERSGCMVYNLYRPPSIEPGDPKKAEPWVKLVREVFPDDAEHIMDYLAHRRQHPEDKINHMLFLGGPPGIGKDSILEPVRRAVGPWNFREVSPTRITNQFNAYVQSVVVLITELRDLGDSNRVSFYETTKWMLASPPASLCVNEKHVKPYWIPNVCGVIGTTNHKTDSLYVPADDRRHYVAWSSLEASPRSAAKWKKYYRWLDGGGDRHVTAFLDARDLSKFDAKAPPPKTKAFWEIVAASVQPEEGELADVLEKIGKRAVTLDMVIVKAIELKYNDLAGFLQDRTKSRVVAGRMDKAGYTAVANPDATDRAWKIGGRRRVVYAPKALNVGEALKLVKTLIKDGEKLPQDAPRWMKDRYF